MAIATNRAIGRIPHIDSFLADHPRAVAGWGRKPSGRRAEVVARLLHRPRVLIEDGFLRSVARHDPPLSLLVDDLGVYYDAAAPSRMEASITAGTSPAEAARARGLIASWCAGGLSKYNHARDYDPALAGPLPHPYVLVADQCHGDLSVSGGLAGTPSFIAMIAAALAENPGHSVLVKVHPDVLTHRKQGYFPAEAFADPRVIVLADGCHPVGLIAGATAVYAVTSLIGFEALLWDRPVRCFGMPFYAGWGLTTDELTAPTRRGNATLDSLAFAALVALPRYADPITGARWQPEQAIAHAVAARAALLTGTAAAR